MEIEDDISSIDSNNLYYNLLQNSTGNENFEIRRTNNTKKNISIPKKQSPPPPITVFGLNHKEIIETIKNLLPSDEFGIKNTKNGSNFFIQTDDKHKILLNVSGKIINNSLLIH